MFQVTLGFYGRLGVGRAGVCNGFGVGSSTYFDLKDDGWEVEAWPWG